MGTGPTAQRTVGEPGVVVSTDPERGHYATDAFDSDAAAVQRAYDDAVSGPTGGTLVLDPADRPFAFDAPLDIWQSDCRVTATGGPTVVPAGGYTGPLLRSVLREETDVGPDGLITDVSVDDLWLDGREQALGAKLEALQLSTVGPLHVRNTDGPGLWLADRVIENLFRDLVLSDGCGSADAPALLIEPETTGEDDAYDVGPAGNVTVNSTQFSGTMIHFPTNDALRIGAGPARVRQSRRHRKIQFVGCYFHGHDRGTRPIVSIRDAYELGFVGTQMLLWREEGAVMQVGGDDDRWPTGSTTVSHCRFTAKPGSDAVGVRCRNVETGTTSLQLVGNTFDDRLAHAVDWGDQPDKRAAWAANGVDTAGDAHVGTLPERADEPPF